jgi:hypothetical protein
MTVQEAAKAMRRQIAAPLWALSVSAARKNDVVVLLVRVDPSYHLSLDLPATFGGYAVVKEWRAPIRARA